MYKLPRDFYAAFFVGKTLEQVCFSANTVNLAFGNDVSITVLSALQHYLPAEDKESNVQKVPMSESKLMQLPEHSVVQATSEADGTLTLLFDNGHIVKVLDDQVGYESYWINDGRRTIIV